MPVCCQNSSAVRWSLEPLPAGGAGARDRGRLRTRSRPGYFAAPVVGSASGVFTLKVPFAVFHHFRHSSEVWKLLPVSAFSVFRIGSLSAVMRAPRPSPTPPAP